MREVGASQDLTPRLNTVNSEAYTQGSTQIGTQAASTGQRTGGTRNLNEFNSDMIAPARGIQREEGRFWLSSKYIMAKQRAPLLLVLLY
jgi:hypothetical protein